MTRCKSFLDNCLGCQDSLQDVTSAGEGMFVGELALLLVDGDSVALVQMSSARVVRSGGSSPLCKLLRFHCWSHQVFSRWVGKARRWCCSV